MNQAKSLVRIQLAVSFCASLLLFLLGARAEAALLYFDPPEASVHRGDTVTLGLRLDTDEGECVNVVSGVITYDANIRAVDVSRGDSILNIWLEPPTIDEEKRTITFAGGLPGGYCGRILGDPSLTNVILDIVFRSPGFSVGEQSKTAQVRVDEQSEVILHDGFGTRANLERLHSTLTLLDTPGDRMDDSWSDRVNEDVLPPADFTIDLFRDQNAFSGQYVISWNSQDKQSGIDHYEVMEEPFEEFYTFKWGRVDAPWVVVESPYVLKDQSLNSTIRVKAVDKAGNQTIATLIPDEAMRSVSAHRVIMWSVAGGILLIVLVGTAFIVWRRRERLVAMYDHETTL